MQLNWISIAYLVFSCVLNQDKSLWNSRIPLSHKRITKNNSFNIIHMCFCVYLIQLLKYCGDTIIKLSINLYSPAHNSLPTDMADPLSRSLIEPHPHVNPLIPWLFARILITRKHINSRHHRRISVSWYKQLLVYQVDMWRNENHRNYDVYL